MDLKHRGLFAACVPLYFLFIFFVLVHAAAAGIQRHGDASYQQYEDIHVLYLKGDAYQIAYSGARLTALSIMRGVIPYMADVLTQTLMRQNILNLPETVVQTLVYYLLKRPLVRELTRREIAFTGGIARGAQDENRALMVGTVRNAYVVPDASHILVSTALDWNQLPGSVGPGKMGCFSVFAPTTVTGTDKALFIRALDYDGINRYDRFPSIMFIEPNDGYRYVTASSAGLFTGGLHGVNEHGLAIAIHAMMSSDVSSNGRSILGVTEEMLRRAKTIDEAHQIARGTKFMSGWQIHMAENQDGVVRSALIEVSSSQVNLIRFDDYSVVVNRYFDSNQRKREYYLGTGIHNYNVYRERRLHELVRESRGALGVDRGIEILRDHYDSAVGAWVSYSPNILAIVDQIQTVIFELGERPDQTVIWISDGMAPSSRGRFVGFPFELGFANRDISNERLDIFPAQARARPRDKGGDVYKGYEEFRRAFIAFEERGDTRAALMYLRRAAEKDDSDWYKLGVAWMLLRLGRYEEAAQYLEPLTESTQLDTHRKNVARLYFGMAYDLQGERKKALKNYRMIHDDDNADVFLKQSAAHWLERPFREKSAASIAPSLKFFESFGYER